MRHDDNDDRNSLTTPLFKRLWDYGTPAPPPNIHLAVDEFGELKIAAEVTPSSLLDANGAFAQAFHAEDAASTAELLEHLTHVVLSLLEDLPAESRKEVLARAVARRIDANTPTTGGLPQSQSSAERLRALTRRLFDGEGSGDV